MNLVDVLRGECIQPNLPAAGKDEALAAIAGLAKKSPILAPVSEEALLEALKTREEMGSTAFGEGVAIPHCRLSGIDDFVVGVATSQEGVPFDAIDGKPVRLFVFIIAPERESNEHIRLLSAISQVLRIPGAMGEIQSATTPEAIQESFLRHTRDEVETKDHAGRNLVHLFVQNEEAFQDLLEIFASMDTCSVMVVEAEQSGTYLAKMPLFAGFWSDAERGFNRIIVAVVDKKLTNDTLRRIEAVVGSLDESREILVTVQEVFYAAGHIDA